MDEKTIQKGFNSGYLLRTHNPALAARFSKAMEEREDDYAIGFLAGVQERTREKIKTRSRNYDVPKPPSRTQERGKDKDHTKEDR